MYKNISYTNRVFKEYVASTVMLPNILGNQYYSLAGDYPSGPGVDCSPSTTPVGNKTQPTDILDNGHRYVIHEPPEETENPNIMYYDPRCT
jgi:hypothetical protein